MKSKLINIAILSTVLFACENGKDGKDGKAGVNGKNGKDAISCEALVEKNQVKCGETTIDIIQGKDGTSGADGKDGKDGLSCELEKIGTDTFVSCGDDKYKLPSPNEVPQDVCTADKLANGNFLVKCAGVEFEVQTIESAQALITIALTPVAAPEITTSATIGKVTSTINFAIPVALDADLLETVPEELNFKRVGENSFSLSVDLENEADLATWTASLPQGLFRNKLNAQYVSQATVDFAIAEYQYVKDLETLDFNRNADTLCVADFNPIDAEVAQARTVAAKPILLDLDDRKAFDVPSKKVVTLKDTDETQVICLR